MSSGLCSSRAWPSSSRSPKPLSDVLESFCLLLLSLRLPSKVRHALEDLMDARKIDRGDLDARMINRLCELPEDVAMTCVERFERSADMNIRHKVSFFMGVIRNVEQDMRGGGRPPMGGSRGGYDDRRGGYGGGYDRRDDYRRDDRRDEYRRDDYRRDDYRRDDYRDRRDYDRGRY